MLLRIGFQGLSQNLEEDRSYLNPFIIPKRRSTLKIGSRLNTLKSSEQKCTARKMQTAERCSCFLHKMNEVLQLCK